MRLRYILTGFGLMLCTSFFDSLRGPLLPLLSHELGLPYEQVSLFLVVGYLSSMATGAIMIPLVERFSVGRVAPVLCLLAPFTAFWSFHVAGLLSLIGFGVLVACASSPVGSTANLFVLKGTDPAYRARFYALLHAMYGFGSQLAPLALGLVLMEGWSWRWLFVGGAVPLIALGIWIAVGLPKDKRTVHTDETRPTPFRLFSIQGLLVIAFAVYVAGEVAVSMWMVAYLVEVRHFTVESAAPYATGFFFVMTATRLACFLVRSDRTEAILIIGGLVLGLTSLLLGLGGYSLLLPLVGFVGPYFPLVLARMSRYLHKEAPGLTLRILLVAQGTLAVCHFGLGYLATHYGVAVAYQVPAFALTAAILLTLAYLRSERRLPSVQHVC